MCNFKYGYSKSIASVVMMVLMATSSYGASCDVLGGRRLHDGQLFYRVAGALDWTEMPDAGVSLGNVRSEFIYIVDETFEAARAASSSSRPAESAKREKSSPTRKQRRCVWFDISSNSTTGLAET
jgi:hypothetical protein